MAQKENFWFFFLNIVTSFFFFLSIYFLRFCKTTNKHHPEGNWKIENKSNFYMKIRFFHKILLKMVKIRKNTVCDEYWISQWYNDQFYSNLTLIPSKFQVSFEVWEFKKKFEFLSFLGKFEQNQVTNFTEKLSFQKMNEF